ncbi:MAG TPA: nucleotidyltransferase family protein [Candidatus Bathyarchaeia archaeon]|nr:nucleotidyltransferase family protein [Candidatus Bathyarchaeia archaeon]
MVPPRTVEVLIQIEDPPQKCRMQMKAFVLAGGAGTRLSPLTSYVPKGMIPIAGRPFIDYVISYLAGHGIRNIIMLLSDEDSEVYRNHLDDGSKYGVNIGYSISPRTGTANALKEASSHIDSTFLVYYGDVLTNLDLTDMIRFHKEKKATCTVALSTGVRIDYGVGRVDKDGRIEYFEEKPVIKEYPVSIGVCLCEPAVLKYCTTGSDIAANVIPALVAKGEQVYGYLTQEPHHDIGSFKQLDEVKKILKTHGKTQTKDTLRKD